jgi:hypothetical protein
MKTPLPEKVRDFNQADFLENIDELAVSIDEIITYLAELTEVVEGKATYRQGYEQGRFDAEMDRVNLEFKQVTPTLKEQLLGEIREKTYNERDCYDDADSEIVIVKWLDVEAIINRLIS